MRKSFKGQADSILRAVLEWTDQGILLTDLNHFSIACNWRFGRFFGLSPEQTVNSDPEEIRQHVYPRLEDPVAWRTQLDEVYADIECVFSDRLELLEGQARVVKRFSSPVFDPKGNAIARLWTFTEMPVEGFKAKFGDLVIDSNRRSAMVAGECARLTNREYELLIYLAKRAGSAVDRETLYRQVWGYDIDYASNTLDVYMHRLRRKLGCQAKRIKTLPKSGYMLE